MTAVVLVVRVVVVVVRFVTDGRGSSDGAS